MYRRIFFVITAALAVAGALVVCGGAAVGSRLVAMRRRQRQAPAVTSPNNR